MRYGARKIARPATVLIKLLFGFGLCTVCAGEWTSVGPLYEEFQLTLLPGTREEAVGPLWYSEEQWEPGPGATEVPSRGGQITLRTLALPPVFSKQERPTINSFSWDFIYPLVTYDRYGSERLFQVLQLLSYSAGEDANGITSEKFSLFPLYFQRRASDPAMNYTALWPVYGHLDKRLFRDEIDWILWPGYVRTRKRETITDNFLAPVFHLRHGPGLAGWQVWPLIGRESQTVGLTTNALGGVEIRPGHETLFALWPIFFHNDVMVGTTNPVHQRLLLPLFSLQLSPAKDIRTYVWPVGLTLTDDRSRLYHQTDFAWPLIGFGRGPSRQLDRVFPLFSRDEREGNWSLSVLWPVYQQRAFKSQAFERDVVRLLLGVYCDEAVHYAGTGRTSNRTDLWPLFIARRDAEGRERFQMLALIEPFLPHNESITRNYSHIWSVWRSEKNPRTGMQSRSFLWNLYRCERTRATRKWSALFGLVQHESGPEGPCWRWLHVFGGKPNNPSRACTAGREIGAHAAVREAGKTPGLGETGNGRKRSGDRLAAFGGELDCGVGHRRPF